MFTGIVEELGTVEARQGGFFRFGARVVVDEHTEVGDSIAVNGCCLTVTAVGDQWWETTAVDETLSRTNLAVLALGDEVNLERPVRLQDRLGGHLVAGHVDATGTVCRPAPDLEVQAPPDVVRYLVPKGSITVDGCSLTVVDVMADRFTVAVIPHTAEVTTLGRRQAGSSVNLEVDVVAKYVDRLLRPHGEQP
ncbi:MAG TPA: riboflavin synthase [Acidimicrobiales bacterium]|jgi:riboflavin synthase